MVKMAINSSGIRDTSRVPGVSKTTVINVLKSKESLLLQVNPNIRTMNFNSGSLRRYWSRLVLVVSIAMTGVLMNEI
ncbi:hypothetical protein [Endozoicomonas sp.]|uniref:hypothetical protein n=1 Tax=Endozoicomonas sp. TaxID=1892382 RepID=UPI00383ABB21